LDLAAQLRGVDVIVGGHSHSLLGDAADLLVAPHALPSDAYPIDPTQTRDKDGHKVCIVQAWQYSRVVGALDVKFNAQGEVTECGGGPKIPLAEPSSWVSASDGALLGADNAATVLAATPSFAFPVTEDEDAASWLEAHRHEIAELQHKVIARFDSNFCHVRIPGTHTDSNGCSTCDTYKRGSAACNFVAQAVLMEEKTADLAIQNGGGCRKDIPHGPYTVGDAFEMLPFDDMVLTVKLTGHEVKQVLEDALTNFLDNGGSTGSYPYAAGLRFEVGLCV
jgi:5'-nucleotidase